jgi:hypothetical protein
VGAHQLTRHENKPAAKPDLNVTKALRRIFNNIQIFSYLGEIRARVDPTLTRVRAILAFIATGYER